MYGFLRGIAKVLHRLELERFESDVAARSAIVFKSEEFFVAHGVFLLVVTRGDAIARLLSGIHFRPLIEAEQHVFFKVGVQGLLVLLLFVLFSLVLCLVDHIEFSLLLR